nr:MAG: hypothetical protein 1 [Leviviridae sp.]
MTKPLSTALGGRMRERHTTFEDLWFSDPGTVEHSWRTNKTTGAITVDNLYKMKVPGNSLLPRGSVVTLDENHHSKLGSFKRFQFTGDVGGDFELTRKGVVSDLSFAHIFGDHVDPTFPNIMRHYDYRGPVLPSHPSGWVFPTIPGLSNLDTAGASLISLVKPTNNVANLATDLAEAKTQGLPHLWGVSSWKNRTSVAKAAGSEYLNHEFGWLPLVSDIRGASYAAANAHTIVQAYERNSHKLVRRRMELPVEMSETWQILGTGRPYFPRTDSDNTCIVDASTPTGSLIQCDRTYKRTWFSGAFTYHLPVGWGSRFGIVDAAAKAGPLMGIELTPEVVWNLVPWTWALDWVSNMGDIVSNTSDMAVDGLVIKYGYVMEHKVTSRTYYHTGSNSYKGAVVVSPVSLFIETKRRRRATPFGFGLDWSGFTPRQLAITAALGLTRIG